MQEHLQEGTSPLNRRERKEFVRDVVQPMVDKVSRPQREFISVAEELDRKYPVALQDLCIKGQPLSRCYDSLFQQMEHRVENNNRGQTASPAEQAKKKKGANSTSSYGCQNWQPLQKPGTDSDSEKVEFLKKEGRKTPRDVDMAKATACMNETYGLQRVFINSTEPVHTTGDVKREWPLLFRTPFFYLHANTLLDF